MMSDDEKIKGGRKAALFIFFLVPGLFLPNEVLVQAAMMGVARGVER